jgi:hypothetical protein
MDYQTHDYHPEDNEPLDLKADFLNQEEGYLLHAFLRSKCNGLPSTHDALSTTQHTNSTFGTFSGLSRYDSDDESIISIKASVIFEVNDSQRNHDIAVVDYDFRLSCGTISGGIEEDPEPALNASCPNFSAIPETGDFVADSNLQDSMSSLNEAFEKLNKCMERTARSRAMIRKKLSSENPVKPLEKEESQRSLISSSSNRSNPSLSGHDSSGSHSSMGNLSWKGPKNISFRTPSKATKVYHNLKKRVQRDLNRVPSSRGLVRRQHISGV